MMYKLPKIPYTMDKDQSAEIPFRGINYSDRLSAGDLADSHGISLRRWPLVTNKRGREKIGGGDVKCRHVTTHDNNIIRFLDNGQINTLDWQVIGSWDETDDRSRRFANINSKTVIMPDKKYIEFPADGTIENAVVKGLEESVMILNVSFETDKLSGSYSQIATVYGGKFKNENNENTFSWNLAGEKIIRACDLQKDESGGILNLYNNFSAYESLQTLLSKKEEIIIASEEMKAAVTASISELYPRNQYDMAGQYLTTYYYAKISFSGSVTDGTFVCDVSTINKDWLDKIIIGKTALKFQGVSSNNGVYEVSDKKDNCIYFKDSVENEELGAGKEINISCNDSSVLAKFKKGDTVTISGCGEELDDNNRTFTIQKVVGNTLYGTENVFVAGVEPGLVTITRKVPELDFICEAENRLWGCNNTENVIYISALGDPTKMYTYEGLTTDSFATAVGSPGDFTGCCRYGSSVLFFKEDKIHKILGTGPADYTLYSYDVEGIQARSDRSAVVINEVLYYKGTHGIYAYDGGVPTLISECFGERIFYDAVAGTDGVSYYVSMRDERYVWYLFSYNTTTGIWTLEDKGFEARDAMRVGMELYFLDKEGQLWKENAVSDVSRSEWMMQFAPLYETMNGKKTYSRILLRAELPKGSYMVIEIRCDGGRWMELGKIVGKSDGVVPIRIPVNRCDKFEIKLRGKGEFVLRSMLREFYVSEEL